jgi:mannose-6-phosphate isomerase-like protein (cupin superfamily)
MQTNQLQTSRVSDRYDCLAPDGSEIRLLAAAGRGSCVHCTLPPGAVSLAVTHRSVEEIWYVLAGHGQVWRKLDSVEETVEVCAGVCLTIPRGAHFQFRNPGEVPLEIVLVTMPPWPGEDEAVRVDDHWPVGGNDAKNQR